jgi:hypothetical protein
MRLLLNISAAGFGGKGTAGAGKRQAAAVIRVLSETGEGGRVKAAQAPFGLPRDERDQVATPHGMEGEPAWP